MFDPFHVIQPAYDAAQRTESRMSNCRAVDRDSATLSKLQSEHTSAPVISVSCARLIRVDFIAAGDLLNWVLAKRTEDRAVQFVDTHRLVALFFGAMGINEHAKVQVRKV